MPVHDWTRVPAGIFHDFHHEWISSVKHAINKILEGTECYALAEQVAGGWGPDVLTLERPAPSRKMPTKPSTSSEDGGIAVATARTKTHTATLTASPPSVRFRITDE